MVAEGLLAHLVAQGTSTQSILAPLNDVALWETLGFAQTETILRYSGGKFIQATHDEVIHYEAWHRMALLRLAKIATGEDRSTLLMEHTYLGQVYAKAPASAASPCSCWAKASSSRTTRKWAWNCNAGTSPCKNTC